MSHWTNDDALTPLEAMALPFLLIAALLLWLSDKVFGREPPSYHEVDNLNEWLP